MYIICCTEDISPVIEDSTDPVPVIEGLIVLDLAGVMYTLTKAEQPQLIGHLGGYENFIRFSPNGRYLAYNTESEAIAITDRSLKQIYLVEYGDDYTWSPDGNCLYYSGLRGFICVNTLTWQEDEINFAWGFGYSLGSHFYSLTVSLDGKTIAWSPQSYFGWTDEIFIYTVTFPKLYLKEVSRVTLQTEVGYVGSIETNTVFIDNHGLLYNTDESIWLVDIDKASTTKAITLEYLQGFKLSPDRGEVAYINYEDVYISKVGEWNRRRIGSNNWWNVNLAWSPDSNYLAVLVEDKINVSYSLYLYTVTPPYKRWLIGIFPVPDKTFDASYLLDIEHTSIDWSP